MKVKDYFNLKTVKKNYDFLVGEYEKAYKMTGREIYQGFVDYKEDVVEICKTKDLRILDISGHSLFSPLLVFKNNYKRYTFFDPGKKHKQINKEILNEIGEDYKISYINDYSRNYDLILDWQGVVNFGDIFKYDIFRILLKMIKNTKKYVIFEAKRTLETSEYKKLPFDFHTYFNTNKIGFQRKETPEWLNDPGCFRYILEIPT